jgi:hypothetical protein
MGLCSGQPADAPRALARGCSPRQPCTVKQPCRWPLRLARWDSPSALAAGHLCARPSPFAGLDASHASRPRQPTSRSLREEERGRARRRGWRGASATEMATLGRESTRAMLGAAECVPGSRRLPALIAGLGPQPQRMLLHACADPPIDGLRHHARTGCAAALSSHPKTAHTQASTPSFVTQLCRPNEAQRPGGATKYSRPGPDRPAWAGAWPARCA